MHTTGHVKTNSDIVVVGAGPAGCAVAIRARQANLGVTVFDACSTPKVAPGETLHPGTEPILSRLGALESVLAADFPRHRGIWIDRGGPREFFPYGGDADNSWLGFQADRRTLHRILQQKAIDAGATLVRNARPQSLLLDGGRVLGVVVNGECHRANWTIDATGRRAWLAQQLGLHAIQRSPPLGVRFGWREELRKTGDGQPVFTFRDDGWDWIAPLKGNRKAWVSLRVGKHGHRAPLGVDLTWRLRPESAGAGYFLLGDAAATFDPSSSHGVLRALLSGMLCGHLMEGWHNAGASEAGVIDAFRAWTGANFKHDELQLRRRYADSPAGACFTDGDFA